MLGTSFSPWPSYSKEEIDRVSEVLASNRVNYWTGDEGRLFEKEFSAWCGCHYSIALANGTAALECALRALNIGPGDEVIVTSRTFLASVACIVNVGATPIFCDIELDSQNISARTIEPTITPKTKGIICVHLAGWPCDMDPILDLAREHGFYVIEDCAQAHGASYKGKPVGTLGDVAAWSFCQDKIITTGGEGGMVTTNSAEIWERIWSFKDHGKSYDAVFNRPHAKGFRWLHESFGTNLRMTEMQAALGRMQLRKIASWHELRLTYACRIWDRARALPGMRVPIPSQDFEHAAYRCYVFVESEHLRPGWTRDRIMEKIVSLRVPCYSGSCSEVYLEKAFENTPFRPAQRLENARILGDTSLAFLVHPTLTNHEIEATCSALEEVMLEAASE